MTDAHRYVNGQRLNDIMEIDHVVEVHEDGSVTDAPAGIYAPGLHDERLDNCRWTLLTGFTGQSGYRGPVMHSSEFIGGAMADDILGTPGIYVAVAAHWSPGEYDDDTEDFWEGWVVARWNAGEGN